MRSTPGFGARGAADVSEIDPALRGLATRDEILRALKATHDPLDGYDAPVLVEDEIAWRFTAQSLLPGRVRWIRCEQVAPS